jgi:hypothetical protein
VLFLVQIFLVKCWVRLINLGQAKQIFKQVWLQGR